MGEPLTEKDSRTLVFLLSTSLAATFNLLVILVICFGLMPAITVTTSEVRLAREEIKESKRVQELINVDMEENRQTLRKVRNTVEVWEAIIKRAQEKDKKKP